MAKKAYIGVSGVARKIKKGYVGVENFTPRTLPSGYTQVEYIQSSGTQYIDTLFNPKNTTTAEVDFELLGATTADECILACDDGWQVNNFSLFKSGVAFGTTYQAFSSYLSGRFSAKIDKGVFWLNEVQQFTLSASAFTTQVTLPLFAQNRQGTISDFATGRLYSCKIYDNGTLVRDYIPCTNASGTVGLYDLANNVFYANAGSGTFTVGATYKGVARKIKKAYIGVGGVARPFWSGGELAYYGTITSLSVGRYHLAATSLSNYALFGGGYSGARATAVDAYNASLTRTVATGLSVGRNSLAAANVAGNYAIFAGGTSDLYSNVVDAYNTSLTRSIPTALSYARAYPKGASVGNYALIAGGYGDYNYSTVDTYNTSLTKGTASILSETTYYFAATSFKNYALFAGGNLSSINAYDTSLTRTTPASLSTSSRSYLAATSVGDYALFGGGSYATYLDTVDAFNTSFTRSTATALSVARSNLAAVSVGDYALFGGGLNCSDVVDAYNASLTRTTPTALSVARSYLEAASIGDYALFAGGQGSSGAKDYESVVDVYTVA